METMEQVVLEGWKKWEMMLWEQISRDEMVAALRWAEMALKWAEGVWRVSLAAQAVEELSTQIMLWGEYLGVTVVHS